MLFWWSMLLDHSFRAGALKREDVAWANVELVKNASEIGYARFLYAGRHG
jgi:hypothetical protein